MRDTADHMIQVVRISILAWLGLATVVVWPDSVAAGQLKRVEVDDYVMQYVILGQGGSKG